MQLIDLHILHNGVNAGHQISPNGDAQSKSLSRDDLRHFQQLTRQAPRQNVQLPKRDGSNTDFQTRKNVVL